MIGLGRICYDTTRTAQSNMIHHDQSFLNTRFSVLLALAESAQLGQGEFVTRPGRGHGPPLLSDASRKVG